MSFSLSSSEISLKDDGVLVATCLTRDGVKQHSSINLNLRIGNKEGSFDVPGRNYHASARDVRLVGSKILCADLASSRGQWYQDAIDLDAFIGNHDGKLVFCGDFDARSLRPTGLPSRESQTAILQQPKTSAVPTPPFRCCLCDDWPKEQTGKRISRVPQLRLSDLQSSKRAWDCPTCALVERIIQEMAPNLAPSREDNLKDVVVKLYSSSQGKAHFNIEITADLGTKLEWKCIMHSNPGKHNPSKIYADINPARLLRGDSSSAESVLLAKRWLQSCVRQHQKCPNATAAMLPARILDIGMESEDFVKLVTTAGQRDTYACLSHCWGLTQTLTLTKDNYNDLHTGIPWNSLQKTYTDAIALSRLLGIRYLWIDALCIVQDSADDWKLESAKMHAYYGNCFLCIAATSAADHEGGCRVRSFTLEHKGTDQEGQPYDVHVRPEVPHIMHDKSFPHAQFFPLLTRAWVYQERRLSPRVLHVTDMELSFECSTTTACECGGSGDQDFLQTSAWTKAQEAYFANHHDVSTAEDGAFRAEHEWRSFAHAYSKLDITKHTDRLPALSGLAQASRMRRELHHVATGRYLAGCWEGSLVNDIAWAVGPELRRLERGKSGFQFPGLPLIPNTYHVAQCPKPAVYIAPSWSWASVIDQVNYAPFGYSDHLCQVHGANMELATDDPYGQVQSGFLIVRAQLLPSRWRSRRSWRGRYAWLDDVGPRQFWGLTKGKGMMWWRDWADGVTHKLDEAEEMYVMPLAARTVLGNSDDAEFSFRLNPGLTVVETAYLVLKLIDSSGDMPVYERVGWASYSGMSGTPDFKSAEHITLKLV
ncbi:HET-domain-containing protein [Thozetella sp. PMI_491]|nr:HET-domain-containing protein [Thozetella sp. PMI_491]